MPFLLLNELNLELELELHFFRVLLSRE